MFLARVDAATGGEIAERMRARIAAHRFVAAEMGFSVTVSIGVSEKTDLDTIEAVLKAADKALYKAKSGGRNRLEQAA